MKKLSLTFAALAWSICAGAAPVFVNTGKTTLLLEATPGEVPQFVYFGPQISEADANSILSTEQRHNAYPAYGLETRTNAAMSAIHADGNMSTDLRVESVSKENVNGAEATRIRLKDTLYPFFVDMYYLPRSEGDMIETWTAFSHDEKKPVRLTRFSSGYLPVRMGDVWLSSLSGSWGNEAQLNQEKLSPLTKIIRNRDGVRNGMSTHSEIMLSLDGKPSERDGRVIGAALCYSGNYEICLDSDSDPARYHRLFAGIDPENSFYDLRRGETFTTPVMALTYSDEGTSGVSRNFHRWARKHRLAHGDRLRKVLLNSWEGIYFNVNEPVLEEMMGDIAGMGGELFVLDDGWFGTKYPRVDDKGGLGDWEIDRNKLPDGISNLLASAEKKGIRFGIWIEPEMVNKRSELYEKHPDWIIQAPGREPVYGRGGGQLVLDLGNPDVQDHVFGVFDRLMSEYPAIDYIKWDANMNVKNHGSHYLPAGEQSKLFINYHRGFENVCRRIREKYPDVTIQACASGGGRVNYGVLPWFDEFWVSDNTDPVQRVYMQWGTSYFFPAIAQASHISASPCHATHRSTPMKFRVDVAMSGRLGMEMQPRHMNAEEKALCINAIKQYKDIIRPVVQLGDQYRLLSPYESDGKASMMYVDPERDNAVFFFWDTEYLHNHPAPRIPMAGLDPAKSYRVTELNRIDRSPMVCEGKVYSGAYLMNNGLEMPTNHNIDNRTDFHSRVLHLEATR